MMLAVVKKEFFRMEDDVWFRWLTETLFLNMSRNYAKQLRNQKVVLIEFIRVCVNESFGVYYSVMPLMTED